MEYNQVLLQNSPKNEQAGVPKSWQSAMDHTGEIFEENAKTFHWVTSTVEFSNAVATGEPFPAKGNPNAHANDKSKP